MRTIRVKAALLAASTLATPTLAFAQSEKVVTDPSAIIVTAQRVEERLQDVPISITVFDQETLANNSIVSARDIATYTPNVVANTRFGNDATTFTIRGFTQAQRTTSTVGTYFADVVAPRGSGVSTGGDGAGPGQLFDLENVQVLKGPQGTLFGRNSTGGAVLLVPTKPTYAFEGYVEGTLGNFDRKRIEAVINVPISDSFRIRAGIDRNKRDGYIKNLGVPSRFGRDMASSDYIAARLSAVIEPGDAFENYIVGYYNKSKSTGSLPAIKTCNPDGPFGSFACAQVEYEAQNGDFWTGSNANPFGGSTIEQWQIINRTTIDLGDAVTLTNILSYGELLASNEVMGFGLFGPLGPYDQVTGIGDVFTFVPIYGNPDSDRHSTAQDSFVEELRLSGTSLAGRLEWQAGLYFEKSTPLGSNGTITPAASICINALEFNCGPVGRSASYSRYMSTFESRAVYAQGSFDVTDRLRFTAGIRYTEDRMKSRYWLGNVFFAPDPEDNTYRCANASAPQAGLLLPSIARLTACEQSDKSKTSAPTWVVGLDYKVHPDVMLYAKWSRGYRQGAVSPAAPDTLQLYDKESVDTYEVGAKASWRGAVPGSFNIAGYYNDFRDQQLQLGVLCDPLVEPFPTEDFCRNVRQTIATVNAGKSRLYGIETDITVEPFPGFRLQAAYSYLKSELQELVIPQLPADSPYNNIRAEGVGSALPFAIPHQFTGSASWTLPLPPEAGELSIGGTLVYMSSYRAVADGTADPTLDFGILPGRTFGNAHITWKGIAGSGFDATFFVTNITNEKMFTHVNDSYERGMVTYSLDEPRMYGLRLKYRFGALGD